MKVYETSSLRNIALASHQGAGKTSLVEAMLFNSGATNRLGEVMQGTTVSDFEDEEISRQMSIYSSLIPIEIAGMKLNLIDAPGYTDFQGEAKNALYVADLALLLVDASSGVEVGTEVYWGFADEFELPRMVVINKVDRENVRLDTVRSELESSFAARMVSFQLPIFENEIFTGVVDVLSMKAYRGTDAPADIPADMVDEAEAARFELIEIAAESDDGLMEKYFEEETLTPDEIQQGLKKGLATNSFVPIVYAAATANIGTRALTDLLVQVAPTPADHKPFVAEGKTGEESLVADDSGALALYVFKTTVDPFVGSLTYFRVISGELKADNRYYNHCKDEEERFGPLLVMQGKEQNQVDILHAGDIGAIAKLGDTITGDTLGTKDAKVIVPAPGFPAPVYAVAVSPATQADSAKMGPTLTRVCDEDPTLLWRQDAATKEAVLEGMGDVHIDVAIKKAAGLGVNLETAIPRVPYQETVTKTHSDRYRHKKQSGGAGQFGEVHLRVEPLERGTGFEYANEVFGGSISQAFIPSIEKGIKGVLDSGVIAGYPVVDVKAIVYDGKEHPVDSKDIAFQIAGREVFKLAFRGAGPVLLEPIVTLKITVPEGNMGDVIGDLSSRRGQVQGTEIIVNRALITATAPLAEVQRYSNDLRSITQGRGVYTQEFSHYQVVPSQIAEGVIAASKRETEEE